MTWFEAYSPRELPTSVSVALSDLIPGDTSGLRVPLYGVRECPEPNFLRAGDYLVAYVGRPFVFPVYASPSMMLAPYARLVSALTPLAGP